MTENLITDRKVAVAALDNLKQKVIKDYNSILIQLQRGYQPSLQSLLDEINFIEYSQFLDNQKLLYEYFINHEL